MANVFAIKTGNWSDPTVWNTGTLPTSADDVFANGFTVTVDISPTVLSLRTASATGIAAGGVFVPTNGITVTATGLGVVSGSTICFSSSLVTGQACTVLGNITGGNSANAHGAINNLGGTFNIVGNIFSGPRTDTNGFVSSSTGPLNITGNINDPAPSGGVGYGVRINGANVTNIVGNVYGPPSFGFAGLSINNNSALVYVTGTVGGVSPTVATGVGYGIENISAGTLVVTGPIVGGPGNAGIMAGSGLQNTFLTGPFINSQQGFAAVAALRWRWAASVGPSYMTVPNSTATGYKNLYTVDSIPAANYPVQSNVRQSTVYGPSLELTGTLAVPPAGSVALGVPVDNTTGTAAITAASIRSAMGLASANLDTQLGAIPTTPAPSAAAVASQVRVELAVELACLDAAISTRLAASGYTAPPSAATIATAVWSATTRTLTTAIDNSATIAAAVWSTVTRTITGGTVDTLTNAPDVPTEGEIADAVRVELTPELARMANAATTQEVGDIVEGAMQLPEEP